jgi:hypothetical protein
MPVFNRENDPRDHAIIEARRAGQDMATWTSSYWVKVLTEEE